MIISKQPKQFTPSIFDISFETRVNISTNASFISAKDRSFADSQSPQSFAQSPFKEPEEVLWQSVLKLKPGSSEYIPPKIMAKMCDDELSDGDNDMVLACNFRLAYTQWRRLILVAKCISVFKKKNGVVRITSVTQLRKSVKNFQPANKQQMGNSVPWIMADQKDKKAIQNFRDTALFYDALERGNNDDIKYIREYLMKDPRNYLNDSNLVDRRANKPNRNGYTPLYIACKNGNMQLLKLLLEFKANPNQLCDVSFKQKESILMVAVRWGHIEIVRHLMESRFLWSQEELVKMHGKTQNLEIKRVLNTRIRLNKSNTVMSRL